MLFTCKQGLRRLQTYGAYHLLDPQHLIGETLETHQSASRCELDQKEFSGDPLQHDQKKN